MDIGKWKILAVSMTLVCCLTVPVLAYIYMTPSYPFSTGIVLLQPTMQLGFYWDLACTQPVTIIDFGEMVHASDYVYPWKTIYIRNEGTNTKTIYWNSTLSATTAVMTDYWTAYILMTPYPLNGTLITSNEVVETDYTIEISPSPPVGTYNWTLTVWGESYV